MSDRPGDFHASLELVLAGDRAAGEQFFLKYRRVVRLLAVGMLIRDNKRRYLAASGWAFVLGIVVFSGSLYVLAVTEIRVLGAITPLGGVAFIAGWVLMLVAALRHE